MTLTKTLSGATLKVTLNGLGLPPSFFAEKLGVTMRTVVRWFDGDTVPPSAVECLDKLADQTAKKIDELVAKAPEEGPVTLRTYRTDGNIGTRDGKWPATWHRLVTFRAMERLWEQGRDVTVEYR
jgi:DNA-binding transcriptional regulator YiaG